MNESRGTTGPITSPQADHDALRHVSEESPCPYLPGRQSRNEAYLIDTLDGELHERLLARGFRRSGRVVYRPACRGCCECRQIRVPVDLFTPTRSMRRVWRRNADIRVVQGDAQPSDAKYALFARYLSVQHDGQMPQTPDAFAEFLYDSPTSTREFCYYVGERLIGVSLVDVCDGGLSSIYMYFDPDHASRSLGTYSALWEIEQCRLDAHPYYYLGYYIAHSPKMAYKIRFRPNEVLVAADTWLTFRG